MRIVPGYALVVAAILNETEGRRLSDGLKGELITFIRSKRGSASPFNDYDPKKPRSTETMLNMCWDALKARLDK